MLGQSIDDLGIAAALAILGARHRHRRQEGLPDRAIAVEASGQHDLLAGDIDQLVARRGDAGLVGQSQSDLLPCLHAVVVGFLGELGDGEMAMLVDNRSLGSRSAK